ncbi:CPXCG motif-containing cysteine-rich protein [Roseiconus lacunae]|uniref:CPXCG motif-containing cysteine-rich protein n=1 Tax=Roseiconus lacunae TaxID=2605694 RepID=A0ABT7PK32_9BACT|nr:CPXCG motif-containing cysteine-rich protein [Roseiconus lacunae]MCD0459349.1 CPXCG motif-containing cysteine-rich protein [Roseiconus lacunae]MDM4016866.1 CPXCG motif-containing cysteine-rich protein [Roseiconus lacunae]WRQ50825.1 CPXCG motif-containing cysteine-rich protein [Stieleria sp. HD01]
MDESPLPETFDGEGSYICENCGEEIVIPLDPIEGGSQNYVEDCPVCCTPMVIHVNFEGAHAIVWAESEQDRF